jgi:hypothetical protein
MQTFTVPADGDYVSTSTGKSFRYHEGDTLPLATAIDLGMPGAVAPADASPFTTAEEARITAMIDAAVALALVDYAAGDHTHDLADLTDVTLTAPADGEVLTFDGTDTWANEAIPA